MRSLWSFLRKEVSPGDAVPRAYRLAWYEPRRNVGVFFLLPLHWVFRGCRELRNWFWSGVRSPGAAQQALEVQRMEVQRQRLAEEFARGYLIGWRECFQVCLNAIEDEIARGGEVWDSGRWLPDAKGVARPKN